MAPVKDAEIYHKIKKIILNYYFADGDVCPDTRIFINVSTIQVKKYTQYRF